MTLEQSIRLNDGMTSVLQRIQRTMDATVSSFERMQQVAQRATPASAYAAAQMEIQRTGGAIVDVQAKQERFNSTVEQMPPALAQAAQQQQNFNNRLSEGATNADGILQRIKRFATMAAGAAAVRGSLNISDNLTQTTARLDLMNDGMRTSAELQNQIFAAAQRSRGSFLDTADAVAKMGLRAGKIFSSNDETIAFVEQLNKQFVIAGASQAEMSSATLQLTQALGSGVLRGEEFNAVFEAAPNVMQTLADYIGVDIGQMRQLAADGEITAELVKNAILGAADQTNAKFESMPQTWAQRWTWFCNMALQKFQPVLTKLNSVVNSEGFEKFAAGAVGALSMVAAVATGVFDALASGVGWVAEHWNMLKPIILGVAAALVVYNAQMGIEWLNTLRNVAIKTKAAFVTMGQAAATVKATIAQKGLNVALMECPLTWIIIAVIALIAIFYAAVAAVNHFAGTNISATGLIAGAFLWLMALIGNIVIGTLNGIIQLIWSIFVEPFIGIIEWVLNVCNGGFDSFGGAVANLIGQIISWFLSLGKVVTKIIDAIFGSDWTGRLSALQNDVLAWGKNENAITLDRNVPDLGFRFDMTDAFDTGYRFGQNIENKVTNLFKPKDLLEELPGLGEQLPFSPDMLGTAQDTATNTGRMADSLEVAEEDLQYLRDIAAREAINRFTTAEIKLDMTNYNSVSSDRDLDGMVDYLGQKLREQMNRAAEGVHA